MLHADVMIGSDGRSKGCGLVTFASPHDAARAIQTLHDSVLHQRSIFVREDREAVLPGLPAPAGRGAGPPCRDRAPATSHSTPSALRTRSMASAYSATKRGSLASSAKPARSPATRST